MIGNLPSVQRPVLFGVVGGVLPFVVLPAMILANVPPVGPTTGDPLWMIAAVVETYLLVGAIMWGLLMHLRVRSVRTRLADLEGAGPGGVPADE